MAWLWYMFPRTRCVESSNLHIYRAIGNCAVIFWELILEIEIRKEKKKNLYINICPNTFRLWITASEIFRLDFCPKSKMKTYSNYCVQIKEQVCWFCTFLTWTIKSNRSQNCTSVSESVGVKIQQIGVENDFFFLGLMLNNFVKWLINETNFEQNIEGIEF